MRHVCGSCSVIQRYSECSSCSSVPSLGVPEWVPPLAPYPTYTHRLSYRKYPTLACSYSPSLTMIPETGGHPTQLNSGAVDQRLGNMGVVQHVCYTRWGFRHLRPTAALIETTHTWNLLVASTDTPLHPTPQRV